MSKKRLVNVHNNTGSTQHEWCIMVQEPPAANVPEILVCLDCGVLLDFGLLGHISNWILTSPPIHQYHHCCSVRWDLAKKVPSLSPADFLQAVSLHLHLLRMHTKDYYALGTLYFAELLYTYLYLSVTSLRFCMSIG